MKLTILLLIALCTACTHNYVKPGVSLEEDSRNKNFCYNYALQKALLVTQYGGDAYMYARAKEEYKDDCMEELGYKDMPR